MMIQKRRIYADEEILDEPMLDEGTVAVAPEATDLLFEAEDVAELIAEVTGEAVEVEAEAGEDTVTFTVGENEFVVEAEGDEEVLEASRRQFRGKKRIAASTRRPAGRTMKRVPANKARTRR